MMGQELEQEEDAHDGEGTAQNVRRVLRELLNELQCDILRGDHRRKLHGIIGGLGGMIENSEEHHHENGADAAECDETEAVVAAVLAGTDTGKADAEGHDKGNRHGSGGDAAGVKGDGQKVPRNEEGQKKQENIQHQQHAGERNPEENAEHGDGRENADPGRNGPDQDGIRNGGHLVGQNLQIRLGNGDERADEKTDEGRNGDTLLANNPAADALAEGGHGNLRTQLEKTHSDDEQHGAHEEQRDRSDAHGNHGHAQDEYDDGDGENTGKGFSGFLFKLFVHGTPADAI